ncbi:hypothetical protein [Streptomyces sp. NPDC005423]|uniref:hypothetical protein n=1 Tax=Streptomyces sp. NPDC005423 TaxID=3155343 RepID=UPI0033B3EABF
MATVDVTDSHVPAWRGGFGRLWTAAVISRFGDALRGAALPPLAGAPAPLRVLCWATALCNVGMGALIATLVILVTGRLDAGTAGYVAATTAYAVGALLGGAAAAARGANTPALVTAGFFVLSVIALIPAVKPDVPVVGPPHDAATAHVTG